MSLQKNIQKIGVKNSFIALFIGALVVGGFGFASKHANADSWADSSSDLGKYYVLVSPDAYYKFRGASVTFNGSHFAPNEQVRMTQNGNTVATLTADGNGNFSTSSYQVPFTDGTVAYTFMGMTSNLSYTINESVDGGAPWITLDTYYTGAGSQIAVIGHNYAKDESVHVWFAGIDEGTATADDSGNFSKTITVPNDGVGQHTISATGSQSNLTATQNFSQAW